MTSSSPVLITGASGFIGSALVRRMRECKLPVIAASRRAVTGGNAVTVSHYSDLVPPPGAVVVHLAELRDVQAANRSSAEEALQCVRALLAKDIALLVYVSSAAVYGDDIDRPRREDEPLEPKGAYATSKLACEREVVAAGGAVARLANTYGPAMAPNNLISDILRQLPLTAPLRLQSASPVRDWIWVEDAADGLLAMVRRRARGVFNLGSGQGVSTGDLAREILAIAGQHDRAIAVETSTTRPSTLVLDTAKAERELGWRAATPRSVGLKRLIGRDGPGN